VNKQLYKFGYCFFIGFFTQKVDFCPIKLIKSISPPPLKCSVAFEYYTATFRISGIKLYSMKYFKPFLMKLYILGTIKYLKIQKFSKIWAIQNLCKSHRFKIFVKYKGRNFTFIYTEKQNAVKMIILIYYFFKQPLLLDFQSIF